MILEMVQAFGKWQVGDITDEVSEGVGRALIEQGTAKPSTEMAKVTATLMAESNRRHKESMDEMRALIQGKRPAGNPPGGQALVDTVTPATRIDAGAPSGKRCLGEAMMCVFTLQSQDAPPEQREWAHNMLHREHDVPDAYGRPTGRRASYASGKVNYKLEDNGDLTQTIERDGVKITRTGTESISGGPTYGFAIKPDWSDTLFRIPMEDSVIEDSCFNVPVGTALEFKWPALDQYKPPIAGQSAAYAGFQLARKGEITQRQYTDGAMSMIEYKITDLTAFTTISRDLDADAYIRIDAMINQVLGQAFQWKKDYEFINGLGIGSPTGFTNGNATITVTRKTGNQICYEDIVAMMQSLHPACWRESRWLTNVTTLPWLVSIKNNAGTLVYQPNSLIAQHMRPTVMGDGQPYNNLLWKAQGMLEGLPVHFTEKLPTLGTANDLCLVHPKSYGVATRSGLEIGMSEHFLFDTDTLAFRFKLRNDGKPLWRAPFTQSDGGTTTATQVSPFVRLK